jgi:hypothetical protein
VVLIIIRCYRFVNELKNMPTVVATVDGEESKKDL